MAEFQIQRCMVRLQTKINFHWMALTMTIEKFMQAVMKYIKSEQQPDFIVIPDNEWLDSDLGAWQAQTKIIRFKKESEYVAERKYLSRIERIEKQLGIKHEA